MPRACQRILIAALAAAVTTGPLIAEEVVLRNGQTLDVVRHEFQGDAVFLYFEGGGTLALMADQIESIGGAPARAPEPPAAEPEPAAAPAPRAAPPDPLSPELGRLIDEIATRHDVPPLLVRAVIEVESRWDPDAVSPKGAMGLMQLMPGTAEGHGVEDPFDPAQNLRGGIQELAHQLRIHDGEMAMALAAYNAGGVAVRRYDGIPPYRETLDYVDRVLELYFTWAEAAVEAGTPSPP